MGEEGSPDGAVTGRLWRTVRAGTIRWGSRSVRRWALAGRVVGLAGLIWLRHHGLLSTAVAHDLWTNDTAVIQDTGGV